MSKVEKVADTTYCEYVEHLELPYSVGGSINWYNELVQLLGKTFLKYLPMINIDIPNDPAIPFLTIYLTGVYTEVRQKTDKYVNRSTFYGNKIENLSLTS